MSNEFDQKSEKRKICLVIPSLQAGGMERVMSELANYFSKKNSLDVNLVLYGKSREVFYPLSENISIHKPAFQFNDSQRFLSTIKTIIFIRKTIKKISPVSVLSFGEYWNSLVLLSLLGVKVPIYISDRCTPSKSFGFTHNYLRKLLYPLATGVIAQTSKAAELYLQQFRNDNILVIGNPIREINNHNHFDREKIIISVGRLISTKHFDRLIQIFQKIQNKDWKLIIIGGDALKQKNSSSLQKMIDEANLNDQIILTGTVKKVDDYLLKASIFAFTSSSEGFPNVIGEALSAGLPVIAYDCIAGPSEMIVDQKNGFLIPLFDDLTFERKLRFLMENENERNLMGAYARESIIRFSIKNIGEHFRRFIFGDS